MVIFSAKSFKQDSLIQGGFLGVLLLGLIWKVVLVVMGAFPFNADEAIVGLMGRHILQGARPIFFYGQAYMGALDAYFAALGFQIFGVEVWVIRLVQILLFLGIIATTMRIAIPSSGSCRRAAEWITACNPNGQFHTLHDHLIGRVRRIPLNRESTSPNNTAVDTGSKVIQKVPLLGFACRDRLLGLWIDRDLYRALWYRSTVGSA
jgi:hypothetical protein